MHLEKLSLDGFPKPITTSRNPASSFTALLNLQLQKLSKMSNPLVASSWPPLPAISYDSAHEVIRNGQVLQPVGPESGYSGEH
jgi:hypothetical protein